MPFLDEIEAAIPGLRAFARALVRDREAADDLVQDTLEAALAAQAQWRGDGPLGGWLCRILMNRFRDGLRRRRPVTLAVVPDVADAASGRRAEGRLALAEVHAAMGQLPEDQRAALLLVALEGMSLAEAAAAMGCAEGTLASRLGRARATLRHLTGREAKAPRPGKAGE
jgi:RNA polymerase sigma-70 factor (ECF subfamily)